MVNTTSYLQLWQLHWSNLCVDIIMFLMKINLYEMLLITIYTAFSYSTDSILMFMPQQKWDLYFAVSKVTVIICWAFNVRCCCHCKRFQCCKPTWRRIRDWTFVSHFQEPFAQTPQITTACLPCKYFCLFASIFPKSRGNLAFYISGCMWKPADLYSLPKCLLSCKLREKQL